ncbi:MAG: B12-binding domain-containing radical SAM protein [Candidatus Bathyarchaeota archaeon]|nr:MAG: B12-binding domain-containing radical SAM protein [Candidatus Bathyarchaeota archaeon]
MIDLVKIDADPTEHRNVPHGLLRVGGSLEQAGYEVRVLHNLESRRLDVDLERFVRIVDQDDPLFVGISVLTGKQTADSVEFSMRLKDRCDVKVVWGGVHPTLLPRQCLQESFIDFVVIGEGEETAVELAEALEGKRPISKVRGLGYKENGRVHINPSRPKIKRLDEYLTGWHLVDLKDYLFNQDGCDRILTYETSRGCPYRCGFCYNQAAENQSWRKKSLRHVVSEIQDLKEEFDIGGVFFIDDNLFVDPRRALQIVDAIKLGWFGEPRIDAITEEVARRISETDCFRLHLGAESGSDRILRMITKGFNVKRIVQTTRYFAKYQVPVNYSFIIGFPTETWDEIMDTVEFIFDLEEIYGEYSELFNPKLGIYIPYPGTPLYEMATRYGFNEPENTKDWEIMDRYMVKLETPWVDPLKTRAVVRYQGFYNDSKRFPGRLDLKLIKTLFKLRARRRNLKHPYEILVYSFLEERVKSLFQRIRGL